MLVAKWESRSGKHTAELHRTDSGFKYAGDGCGGYLVETTEPEAIAAMERRVASGYFQPDANVTPMRRTI